jgi:tetratricopeptide (TPR) repeat protein
MYELAHDTLAVQVASERSASEIAFLEMVKLVKDRFYAYDKTQTLLNQSELHLLNAQRNRAEEEDSFTEDEWTFIEKSSKNIRRRRLGIGGVIMAIIMALSGFSIYAFQQQKTAEKLQEEAVKNLQHLQKEQTQKEEARYNEHLAKGKAWMAQNDFSQAIQEFSTALAFREKGKEADSLRKECEEKLGLKARFEQLIANGDALYQDGADTYVDAIAEYRKALNLGYNDNLAQNKINAVMGRLDGAFDNFIKKGDAFYNADACDLAVTFYRKALRIKPSDQSLQKKIRECEQKLNP